MNVKFPTFILQITTNDLELMKATPEEIVS